VPRTAVSLSNIHVAYRQGRKVVDTIRGLSLDIEAEQLVALVGPSGCGKTTLLRLIAGLTTPSSGVARVHGLEPRDARLRRWLSLVSQRPALLPNRTIEQNIRLPLDLAGERDQAKVSWALDVTHLAEFRNSYPHQLSGGMRQRAAIARAYVTRPFVLLLDEPFSSLDELLRERLGEDFSAQQRALHQTAILVTHSIEEAVLLGDRVVVFSGRPARVLADIVVDVQGPRDQTVRNTPAYFHCVARIRSLLREEAHGSTT
jgi:NitT/TauT family transport system ATP-binding protein